MHCKNGSVRIASVNVGFSRINRDITTIAYPTLAVSGNHTQFACLTPCTERTVLYARISSVATTSQKHLQNSLHIAVYRLR